MNSKKLCLVATGRIAKKVLEESKSWSKYIITHLAGLSDEKFIGGYETVVKLGIKDAFESYGKGEIDGFALPLKYGIKNLSGVLEDLLEGGTSREDIFLCQEENLYPMTKITGNCYFDFFPFMDETEKVKAINLFSKSRDKAEKL